MQNSIRVKVYNTSGEIQNAGMDAAQDVTFDHVYPGGRCVSFACFVARDPVAQWPVQTGHTIKAWNGEALLWEGIITGITPTPTGMILEAAGYWGYYLMARKTLKVWADTRMEQGVWAEQKDVSVWLGCEKARVDRENRIRITPTSVRDATGAEVGWSNGNNAALKYTTPAGETVKRIVYNYDLQEGSQQWELGLRNEALTILVQITSTGTGSTDHTLATPDNIIYLYMAARANQTPATDGTMYAEFSAVTVYTETGNINAQEITKDIRAMNSEFSADESGIGALTLSLVPFGAVNGPMTYADLLTEAASYGDASYNRWAVYVGMSDTSTDGLPPLVLAQVPALTDYDYALRMDEPNIVGELSFREDAANVRNWIAVEYADEAGNRVYITPDTDATLTDADSVTLYGRRDEWLTVDTTSATTAANYGRRFLAQRAAPEWVSTGAITVTGYIRTKTGAIPSCEIVPGTRLKIENYLNDISGDGLVFLITGTSYNDADSSETCTIEIGTPDTPDALLLRMARLANMGRLGR